MKKLILFCNIVCVGFLLQAQPVTVDTLLYNGEFAFNIVIIGDGYTISELGLFDEDAHRVYEGIFSETPFKEYKSFFNVFCIEVISNESGVKCCKKEGHCDECEDPDNYFESEIVQGTRVSTNSNKVISTVKSFIPNYDNIVVLVNSAYDFGTAYPWCSLSINPNNSEYGPYFASYIVLHELGHSIGGLGDEYNTGTKEYHQEQIEYGYPNLDIVKNRKKVKWSLWIGLNQIGTYDHIKGKSYIPHEDCRMNNCDSEFCSVCTEQLVVKFYEYIYKNKKEYFNYCSSHNHNKIVVEDSLVMWFSPPKPEPNTLTINWYIENQLIASNVDSIILSTKDYEGIKTLRVIVLDNSSFIISEELRDLTSMEFEWEISFERKSQEIVHSETEIVENVISVNNIEEINSEQIVYEVCDTIMVFRLYFDFDKSILNEDEIFKFNEMISEINSKFISSSDSISLKVSIFGYADTIGTKKYNELLSLKRANSIFSIFARVFQITHENVILEGKGETNDYPELWQNRYVEVVVYYENKKPLQQMKNLNYNVEHYIGMDGEK